MKEVKIEVKEEVKAKARKEEVKAGEVMVKMHHAYCEAYSSKDWVSKF